MHKRHTDEKDATSSTQVFRYGTGIFGRVLAFESLALAADETSRIALAGMLEASQGNFGRGTELAGAHYQMRTKSLADLLAIGEIDPLAARRVLGM